jgi:hypothetical protein
LAGSGAVTLIDDRINRYRLVKDTR